MVQALRGRLSYANVMVTLLGIVVIGGGSLAIGAVTNDQGEIQACYDKKGGNAGEVRLLVKGKCTRAEQKILWNQEGPPGVAGETGQPGTPGDPGQTGPTGPPGPGAKLLVREPVASASNEFVQLGQAGPFTLHTRCRISGGTVDAQLVATGPALTTDATYVKSGVSPTLTITESDFETAPTIASPRVVGNSSAPAGGNAETSWASALLQANSSVSIQAWVRAESAGGVATDSCRISAIVTPLE